MAPAADSAPPLTRGNARKAYPHHACRIRGRGSRAIGELMGAGRSSAIRRRCVVEVFARAVTDGTRENPARWRP